MPPLSITFTRGGVSPVSITFSRGKARLLYINLYCYARTSGAAECLRCRLRSRAVKRAYFTLTYTAMHAHPVRRRTAPVSYVRRHAPYGALYGYCIKTYKFFFLSSFAAPNAKFMLRRVNKLPHDYQSGTE